MDRQLCGGHSISSNFDSSGKSRTRLRKNAVLGILRERDLAAIREWGRTDPQALRTLSSMLFETDPLLRWRTIEAMGYVAAEVGRRDIEAVRRLIRRLLWLMNDESGGICWHAPEAIAEVLFRVPMLIDEFSNILISFLPEEPFEVGVRLGIARLAAVARDRFAKAVPLLKLSLQSDDDEIALASSFALRALGEPVNEGFRAGDTTLAAYDFELGQVKELNSEGFRD